ncbi:phage major capsid protein [Alysiella crassa]|uniref:Predicted phage phi-C31 gp36 major capsid-like protein n=1 Tax=Alysiella crassa TaxID=153491 RepID=A0A376BTQ7_9NEIS|nr:phage major capsid protein [Alysiella crassa]UOP05882.1 phage major capsid protein [Alysiella crassa]SSY80309.1 Predicted phage phi-C31 gp36 major capsid-like protein [Alysiella crassa]
MMKNITKAPISRGLQAVFAQANEDDGVAQILAKINELKASKDNEISALKEQIAKAADTETVNALKTQLAQSEQTINSLSEQIAALQLNGGVGSPNAADKAAHDAILAYMRMGDIHSELKKSDNGNGGYLVPTEWDRTITDKLQEFSPARQVFFVQPTSKPTFEKLYNLHGSTSGWVGETDERPNTNTPTFKTLKFETGEVYANPSATQQILDDAEIDLGQFLATEVQNEFTLQENKAFFTGDGENGKPTGLLTYAEGGTNATKHPLGAIKVVKSGDANKITYDGLIDLVYSLPSIYAQNAQFLMSRNTIAVVRKLKDADGNPIWQPSLQAGQPSTLLGYPVVEMAEMPDVAANALPIAFGDFKRGYMILDRKGVSVLRDNLTKKGYVQFYTTKRVGGGVSNPEAMRLLKIAA